jgi:hypothetical protein
MGYHMKTYLKETRQEIVDWIHLALCTDKWQALVFSSLRVGASFNRYCSELNWVFSIQKFKQTQHNPFPSLSCMVAKWVQLTQLRVQHPSPNLYPPKYLAIRTSQLHIPEFACGDQGKSLKSSARMPISEQRFKLGTLHICLFLSYVF